MPAGAAGPSRGQVWFSLSLNSQGIINATTIDLFLLPRGADAAACRQSTIRWRDAPRPTRAERKAKVVAEANKPRLRTVHIHKEAQGWAARTGGRPAYLDGPRADGVRFGGGPHQGRRCPSARPRGGRGQQASAAHRAHAQGSPRGAARTGGRHACPDGPHTEVRFGGGQHQVRGRPRARQRRGWGQQASVAHSAQAQRGPRWAARTGGRHACLDDAAPYGVRFNDGPRRGRRGTRVRRGRGRGQQASAAHSAHGGRGRGQQASAAHGAHAR